MQIKFETIKEEVWFVNLVLLNKKEQNNEKVVTLNSKEIQKLKREKICHFCPAKRKRNSEKLFPLNGIEIQNNWRRGIICQSCLTKQKGTK